MKLIITNQTLGVILIIGLLCLPFISALTPRHKILYDLSQYENYVPYMQPGGNTATFQEERDHDRKRAAFLASMGISRGELWMSRLRGIILIFGSITTFILIGSYINALLSNEIRFKTEVSLKSPFKPESEEDRLERLGRKLLNLPIEEQNELMERMKESQTAMVVSDREYIYNSKNW